MMSEATYTTPTLHSSRSLRLSTTSHNHRVLGAPPQSCMALQARELSLRFSCWLKGDQR